MPRQGNAWCVFDGAGADELIEACSFYTDRQGDLPGRLTRYKIHTPCPLSCRRGLDQLAGAASQAPTHRVPRPPRDLGE